MKKRITTLIIVYYLFALSIIAIGFFVGDGFNIYTNHPSNFISPYYNQVYGWQKLDEMFDGTIDKYYGWYGIHWEKIYSAYQITDEEISYETLKYWNEDIDYNWSEKEFVDYISDSSTYMSRAFDFIKIDNKMLAIEYNFTYNVSLHDEAIPKIITIFSIILLIPLFVFAIVKIYKIVTFKSKKYLIR